MKTQVLRARAGDVTEVMKNVARQENMPVLKIQEGLANGSIAISSNRVSRNLRAPLAVGKGTRTKVNANIGTSNRQTDLNIELDKLQAAQNAGADAIMDLSTGGDLGSIRKAISAKCFKSMGTVPIYQAIVENAETSTEIDVDRMFEIIREHAEDGVDFVTVHCGITLKALERLEEQGRVMDVVSRGGAFLAMWMRRTGRENPLYEQYDRLLEIALKYDIILSLGDALRPGSILDATDRGQIEELTTLGGLAKRANQAGVGVIIEGPGHVPLNQIKTNIELEKALCNDAPFYVLGPLVTDIAPGYDHITAAIGGAIAGAAGGDFLCYVTPSEHLQLPTLEDVHEGVIASRIAAHAADIAKGIPGSIDIDRKMSIARKKRDWNEQAKHAIDPGKVLNIIESASLEEGDVCTMCGDFCSMKVTEEIEDKCSVKKAGAV